MHQNDFKTLRFSQASLEQYVPFVIRDTEWRLRRHCNIRPNIPSAGGSICSTDGLYQKVL